MAGRLVDTRGAAEYLGLTQDQIRGLVYRRQIPHLKIGRALKFDIRTLDRWVEQHTIPAEAS